jgi:hypothetical protein
MVVLTVLRGRIAMQLGGFVMMVSSFDILGLGHMNVPVVTSRSIAILVNGRLGVWFRIFDLIVN